MGLSAMTVGVYLSEITTVKLRGPILGMNQTSPCIGMLLTTSVCVFLPLKYLSLIHLGFHVLLLLLIAPLPLSPQWLLRKGKEDEARKSVLRIRGKGYNGVNIEVDEIKEVISQKKDGGPQILVVFRDRTFYLPLLT